MTSFVRVWEMLYQILVLGVLAMLQLLATDKFLSLGSSFERFSEKELSDYFVSENESCEEMEHADSESEKTDGTEGPQDEELFSLSCDPINCSLCGPTLTGKFAEQKKMAELSQVLVQKMANLTSGLGKPSTSIRSILSDSK